MNELKAGARSDNLVHQLASQSDILFPLTCTATDATRTACIDDALRVALDGRSVKNTMGRHTRVRGQKPRERYVRLHIPGGVDQLISDQHCSTVAAGEFRLAARGTYHTRIHATVNSCFSRRFAQ